jgi:hypothetical protein
MSNLPANYNASGQRGFFARARALVLRQGDSGPSIPTNTLGGTTTQFDAYALYNRKAGYVCSSEYDERDKYAESYYPWHPLIPLAALAKLSNDLWGFKGDLMELASRPVVTVPHPRYSNTQKCDVKAGDIEDSGIGYYETVKVLFQVTAIDKSKVIPFARQLIDPSISNKLDAQEKRLLGYVRTENDPLALPNYSKKLSCAYLFVSPVDQISDYNDLSRARRRRLLDKRFGNLSDAVRYAYECKSADFTLLEIFRLKRTTVCLPAALQAELIAARAIANLSSDERMFMSEQKIVRETRMRNRYAKIAALQGADEVQDTVKSAYIWLTIDKEERLRGTVVAGKYINRTLHDMTGAELFDLYVECKVDPDSKGLCEVFLDYISPRGWKKTAKDDFEKAADEMTLEQAYSELGVDAKSEVKTVKSAYRKLLKKTHPDNGGDENQLDRVVRAMNKIKGGRPDLRL